MSDTFGAEAAVIGGGPAGLVAAIALVTAGVNTLLIAPPHARARAYVWTVAL